MIYKKKQTNQKRTESIHGTKQLKPKQPVFSSYRDDGMAREYPTNTLNENSTSMKTGWKREEELQQNTVDG